MGEINVKTDVVRNTVNTISSSKKNINNNFGSVKAAISKLNAAWDGKASNRAISDFKKIEGSFNRGNNGIEAVLNQYAKFLADAVAIDYEHTEDVNKKLSSLFK